MGLLLLTIGLWGLEAHDSFLVFQVNPVHHILEVVAGAAALWVGWSEERRAGMFSLGLGAGFGLLAVMGFMGVSAVVDVLGFNRADHWLHLLVGGAFLAAVLRSAAVFSAGRGERPIRNAPATDSSPGI